MVQAKFKIYKNIICLETASPTGSKWWDQGYALDFAPLLIQHITHMRHGRLSDTGRQVIAARIIINNQGKWVAINPPRSDIFALIERDLWPEEMPKPYDIVPEYSPFPEPL